MVEDEKHNLIIQRKPTIDERVNVEPPKDKFHLGPVMATFFGICALLPWNAFLNNILWFKTNLGERKDLVNIFSSTFTVTSNLSTLLTFIVNTMFLYKTSRKIRMFISLGIMMTGFIVIMISVAFSFKGKETIFFVITIVDGIILCACSSFCQSAMFAHFAYFPPIYFVGYLLGQGLAGVIISLIAILVTVGKYNLPTTALIYFGSTLGTVILCLLIFVLFTISPQYKYYLRPEVTEQKENVNKKKLTLMETLVAYKNIALKIPHETITILLVFSVTLMYFPELTLGVKSMDKGDWGKNYFALVYVFLMYNTGDAIGRYLPKFLPYPNGHSMWVTILSIARFGFLPLFLMCNKDVNTYFPSLVFHDSFPIILMLLFGISNGHLSTLAFASAVQNVCPEEKEMCNTFTVLLLGSSLTIGSFFSFAFNLLVTAP